MENHRLTITLVVDNQAGDGLLCEHGFAAWIDAGGQHVLFDTGQSALIANCQRLGLDPARADALVLSHGHYDHAGCVVDFLACNAGASVFFGPGFGETRFSCHPNQPVRDISIGDAVREALAALPENRRVRLTSSRYLSPGLGISGPIPRETHFEDTGGPFFLDAEKHAADTISDEISLWLETPTGLVILTGCCHAGLVNTVQHIRRISGHERIRGIIGGLHLVNASAQRLDETCRFLADCAPDFIVPCHCTGEPATARLLAEFGATRVQPGYAGRSWEI